MLMITQLISLDCYDSTFDMPNHFEGNFICYGIFLYLSLILIWSRQFKCHHIESKNLHIYSHYHVCWWADKTRSQAISRHGINQSIKIGLLLFVSHIGHNFVYSEISSFLSEFWNQLSLINQLLLQFSFWETMIDSYEALFFSSCSWCNNPHTLKTCVKWIPLLTPFSNILITLDTSCVDECSVSKLLFKRC